ncbi:MAG TPA: DeoR/GlpR family DNA-binding transcription regulator [Daejeonella sp.]|nr:DeoR/GlpR family DNA-binding transcription regulator [Daejeonella sp.]
MLQEERQNLILNQISVHHKVLNTDLCKLLSVSLDTVRRDLTELEKSGKLVKVHGGALSNTFQQPFQQPDVYAKEKKKEIARKALSLLHDGMMILTAGGTIMLELARIIPENFKGTLFTVSPLVALEVAQRSTAEVILLAGKLSRNSYICTGATVISQIAEIKVDLCLIGTNGISLNEGVTDYDWEVVQVKKEMIKSARKTAVLSISEKLDTAQNLQVSKLHAIDYLISELEPTDQKIKKYAELIKTI